MDFSDCGEDDADADSEEGGGDREDVTSSVIIPASSCKEDRYVIQLERILPEELRVDVALEFGLELALISSASFVQSSESSPDSSVLRELLNRLRTLLYWESMLGSFRLTRGMFFTSFSLAIIFGFLV